MRRRSATASATEAYARKHKAAVEMQTGAVKLVLLCERRIGVELKKIRRSPGAAQQGAGRRGNNALGGTESIPTIPQLGLTHTQSSEFQKLAQVEPAAIERAAAEANAAGKPLAKADVMRAGSIRAASLAVASRDRLRIAGA